MTDSSRRALLRTTAGLLPMGMAGCLSRGDASERPGGTGSTTAGKGTRNGTETTPDGTTGTGTTRLDYETYGFDAADRGGTRVALSRVADAEFAQRDVGNYYLALLSAGEQTDALAPVTERDGGAREFVAGTAFDREILLVFQDRSASSSPDLAVDAFSPHGGWIGLHVRYPGEGATADMTTETLLVRVPRADGNPEHATATFTPQHGDSIRFSTAGKYDRPELDVPRDVVVRNRDCSHHRLSVTVTADGELIHDGSYKVAAGTARRIDDAVARAANYEVTVAPAGGEEPVSASWTASNAGEATDAYVTVAGDGSPSLAVAAEAPPVGEGCEATDLPYESPDPEANVQEPQGLWLVNRSSENRALTVAVDDGDARVFERDYELSAESKRRSEPILAKEGSYALTVTPEEGKPAEETWRVAADTGDVTVLVEADGAIQVSQ